LLSEIDTALINLALPQIVMDEQLMEWREEFKEIEPIHRHVSLLYMHPYGNQIDPQTIPELMGRKEFVVRWPGNYMMQMTAGEGLISLFPGNTYPE
jgi:hypothetical protein